MRSLWIGVAGFAGAVARYQLEGLVSRSTRGAFPWGTLVVIEVVDERDKIAGVLPVWTRW